jgi:hypothetical protein
MLTTTVDFAQMADDLLPLDQVRSRLAATEPLSETTFPTSNEFQFTLHPGWEKVGLDDLTNAVLITPGGEQYALTRGAIEEAGAQVGIPRKLQNRMRPTDLESMVNWWFKGAASENSKKDKEFKLLYRSVADGLPQVLAMCRGTITPFSNVQLLDTALAGIYAKYGEGTPVFGDFKFQHDLELTNLRLIIPGESRIIEGTRQADDSWSAGIDIRNSLIGLKPPIIQGYLFRWWCTNGSTENLLTTGKFSRRGKHDDADVWEWARNAVDGVLGGLEGAFEAVQTLTNVGVSAEVTAVLRDLFSQYGLPQRERQRIIDAMANTDGEITMYDIMQAVTQAANMGGLEPRAVEQLLALGGHISHAATIRCSEDHPCRRLMPDGYVPPGPAPVAIAAAE